jgi:hypothetical protein
LGGDHFYDGARKRLEPATATVRGHLSKGSRPTWLTGLLVALLAWPLGLVAFAPGLDYSWMSGLFMGAHHGRLFGSELVFTYGPLGFLAWPELWYSWLAVLAYAYSAAIYVAFCLTMVWMLKRSVGLFAAAVVTFLFLVTVPDLEELPLLLAVAWALAALRSDRPAAGLTLLVVGGGLLSAIEPLVKLSVGPPTVLVVILGLAGARAGRRQWSLYAAIAIAGFFLLWFLSGQGLGNLGDYFGNGKQIISGYSEAMGIDAAPAWQAVLLVAFALGLVALAGRADLRDRRARWFATALTAVAAYVIFKYGITRFHPSPVSLALSALLGIFLLIPWPRQRAAVFLTASVVLGALAFHTYPAPARLDVVANLTRFKESAELVARPGLRQGRIDQARAAMQASFALDPKILAAVEGKRVAIDPWEISVAWAYELDWSPLPSLQNYVAYTSQLDRLNAAAVEDPEGPQVILRNNPGGLLPLGGARSFEGRQPAWDPPEQGFATVCNFAPTVTAGTWQVLSRIPDRCGEQRPAGQISAQPGETVDVPQAGHDELVLLRLGGVAIEGLREKLLTQLWRPSERFAVLNDGLVSYRLVPDTAEDGLIVSRDPALDGSEGFEQLPEIENMKVEGVDRTLEFDFYRVKVRPRAGR